MFNNPRLSILCFISAALVSCNMNSKEKTKLSFVSVSDSVYKSSEEYKKDLSVFKNYYEKCANEQLYPDVFYLELQQKMYIGSINNEQELAVNKGINVLDTSNGKNIFDLLAVISSSNCSDTISLNSNMRKVIYADVINALNTLPEYKSLSVLIDTVQMKLRIGTVYNSTLRTDSLISLLNRTQDSSLIRYKQLLLMPRNALLAQTIDVMGFSAEFPVKGQLSGQLKKQFGKEVYISPEGATEYGSILLLPNNNLRIQINKRYTVLGRFLQLKEEKTQGRQ
jgi:hypothetical protein